MNMNKYPNPTPREHAEHAFDNAIDFWTMLPERDEAFDTTERGRLAHEWSEIAQLMRALRKRWDESKWKHAIHVHHVGENFVPMSEGDRVALMAGCGENEIHEDSLPERCSELRDKGIQLISHHNVCEGKCRYCQEVGLAELDDGAGIDAAGIPY
jgi:hypothetical protein